MEFWQSIKGRWNQLKQWTLWRVAGTPSNAPESALWYDTTEHRAAIKDDSKTQHLAHVEDLPNYSGVFTLPTITVGAGGVLTIGGDGYIYAREDANYTGIPKLWNPAGATLNLVSGADQWLVYTAGVGYSLTTINPGDAGLLSNKVPLYRYQYEFGRVHSEDQDQLARGQSEKNAVRVAFTEFYKRARDTGLELTMSNLLVNISGAYVYRGPVIDSVVPFVGGTNQLYRHSIANSVWSEATVAGIDTSIYNPSTGIATLQANKFAWAHVYRSIGDAVEAFVVYGDSYFSTEAAALAGFKLPSALTATIRSHCVRVASVLYKKGDATIPSTRVYTAWVESTIGSTGIPNHNELGLIDGGDPANNYYGHLSAAQRLLIVNSGAANGVATLDANGKVPSGQLPSYVDDVLEYATKAGFPATGESGKIYVDLSTNLTWRWSGSAYVEISPSLALGETSATAYRGDRGKIAYDHSQAAHAPANADNTQAALNAAAAKTTPVDADVLPLLDSAASWAVKKLSWANIKATLKTYLDTLYSAVGHGHAASTISDFANTVRATALTGLSTATDTAIAATDNVLGAFGKLQAQITANAAMKVDKITKGGIKTYNQQSYRRWKGVAQINFADRYHGGAIHIVVNDRFCHYDIYIRGNGVESSVVIDNFTVMYEGTITPNLKLIVSGFYVYVYIYDANPYTQTSVISMEICSGSWITLSPLDYDSGDDPGVGIAPYQMCEYGRLDLVKNLTSDAQAQFNGKAPTIHTHTTAQVTGLDAVLAGKAPTIHTHTTAQVTGLDAVLAGKAPTTHPHTTAQVTGLDAVLAGKAPTIHTHTTAQVTGLDAVLAGKAATTHPHGNLSNDGKLGTTANLPVQTGAGGVIQAGAWYASNPAMDGTASAGSSNSPARGDHRHPTDTSRLGLGSGTSAGCTIVVRGYSVGNSYADNTIYLET